jgi:protein-histidine N-methyltransferase
MYFGVGGGVTEFVRAVEGQERSHVYTVWDCKVGVRRRIMRVEWHS